jgi:hypothetical protein
MTSYIPRPKMDQILLYRMTTVALLASAIIHYRSLDAIVAQVWEHCKASALFRHETWEPGLVVVSWVVFTAFWCVLFCDKVFHDGML